MTGEPGEPLLMVHGVSKQFGGTQALVDAGLHVDAGEIVALLGANGAGKSTLIKILAGVHALDSGTVTYRGREATRELRRLPIAFIHQDLGLVDWMTVAENMSLVLGFPRRYGLIDWPAVRHRARRALEAIDVEIDPDRRVRQLTRTEKSLVAIARALAAEAEILVLDEPTASLPADEVARLFAALRLLRERGIGMIYVSHRLDEVFEIADRVIVLRDGRVVIDRPVRDTRPEELVTAIAGTGRSQVFTRPGRREGASRIAFDRLAVRGIRSLTCDVHAGEIVGFVGLRGAGQESIGRMLFGLLPATAGRVLLDGRPVTIASPREAMRFGISLICADRMQESVVPGLSVTENLFLNPTAAGCAPVSWLDPDREACAASDLGTRVRLSPNRPALPIEHFSGGNQQKVVVGRWLHLCGHIVVFEDPTAGVDVGAKADIYRLFDTVLGTGAAILVISTDFEEVAATCHRAFVFGRGAVVAELSGDALTAASLLAAASAGGVRVGPIDPTSGPRPCSH